MTIQDLDDEWDMKLLGFLEKKSPKLKGAFILHYFVWVWNFDLAMLAESIHKIKEEKRVAK